jgi:hypothetical protein
VPEGGVIECEGGQVYYLLVRDDANPYVQGVVNAAKGREALHHRTVFPAVNLSTGQLHVFRDSSFPVTPVRAELLITRDLV